MAGKVRNTRNARAATIAKLAAGEAARNVGTKTANYARRGEARRLAVEKRHLEAADRIVTVLGTMKGAAMKIGQMLSVLDVGIVPEEARPEFQRKLAALRDAAPPMPFSKMRGVIEEELGGSLESSFESFDPEPFAAASIGQVYRATLKDGRTVAVKVQYPRIAAAVRADVKNLSVLARMIRPIYPGVGLDALVAEVRDRVIEELDYRAEAFNHQKVAEIFRGHPFIVIPELVPELCGERMLVAEFVEGRGADSIAAADEEVRRRVGEIVYRFYCGTHYRLGEFCADPHPGNFLLLDDGRMAFFDFGMYKRMDPAALELEIASQRAASDGDADALHRLFSDAGILHAPETVEPQALLDYVLDAIGWYLIDEELELTPGMATEAFIASADPRSAYYETFRHHNLPAEHLLARRVELSVMAILGNLQTAANWHRIAREWLYDAAPETELGVLEHKFYAGQLLGAG